MFTGLPLALAVSCGFSGKTMNIPTLIDVTCARKMLEYRLGAMVRSRMATNTPVGIQWRKKRTSSTLAAGLIDSAGLQIRGEIRLI